MVYFSKCLYFNITILCEVQYNVRTLYGYQPGIFFKVSILLYYYIVEVQHNVRTLYGYQPWYIFQSVYISILLYCVEVQYNVRTLYG